MRQQQKELHQLPLQLQLRGGIHLRTAVLGGTLRSVGGKVLQYNLIRSVRGGVVISFVALFAKFGGGIVIFYISSEDMV